MLKNISIKLMSLNIDKKGRPIAKVKGGKFNDTIIYVSDNPNDGFEELELTDGKFQLIPDKNYERQIHYVTGASGSGKSTFVSNYLKEYKKMFKQNPSYLFSHVKEDDKLDKLKPMRIKLGGKLVEDPITNEMMKDSVAIFDDIDVIKDKDIKNAVEGIRDEILETGRHHNTSALITNHLPTGRELKRVLNECHTMTWFPMNYNRQQKYFLENYAGFDKNQIKRIRKSGSRWACFFRHYPQVVMLEKEMWINKPED